MAETTPKEIKEPRPRSETTQVNWEKKRQQLADELSKIWPEGVSVTDIISEMRR